MMRYRLSVTRAQGRRTVAGIVIVVALLATTAHSQTRSVDAELPREGAVGETFTIDGSMPETCKPGTGEIGFDPDDLTVWEGEDPRSGNEIVVATPAVPGAFSETFQVPPIAAGASGSPPTIYAGCVADNPFDSLVYTANTFIIQQPGAGTPTPGSATPTVPSASGSPAAAIAGGVIAALLVAGAALTMRARRRTRTRDDRPSDHTACVTRHDAASKRTEAAKARLDPVTRTSVSELMSALDALAVEIESARTAFERLGETPFDEQAEVVDDLLDAIVEARR
jgi:hypothetical protein